MVQPVIIETTKYQTVDGKQFDNAADAEAHELDLLTPKLVKDVNQFFEQHGRVLSHDRNAYGVWRAPKVKATKMAPVRSWAMLKATLRMWSSGRSSKRVGSATVRAAISIRSPLSPSVPKAKSCRNA